MRQIFLDTETTGLEVSEGHRVIEIGALEMVHRRLTGRHFHYYINPERSVEKGAVSVHGLDERFLKDKPKFMDIAQKFFDFICGADLIAHNAPFDIAFLENEFLLTQKPFPKISDVCHVIDSLVLARQVHPGQKNSLDALCKRYQVDDSERTFHGALLDARLLSRVYLLMTSGQTSLFDGEDSTSAFHLHDVPETSSAKKNQPNLKNHVITASQEELVSHQKFLELLSKESGQTLDW